MLLNLSPLDFDLSRTFKFKGDDAIGLPIYGFMSHFEYIIRTSSRTSSTFTNNTLTTPQVIQAIH